MLTAEDRVLGHKLAGEWLGHAGEHETMVLAEHFERGSALDKAATYYARAAAQALEGNDFTAARMRADRAIRAGASGAALGQLYLLLAEASRWAGEHDAALDHARIAMKELGLGSDDWYMAVAEAVDASMTLGMISEAELLARRVRELQDEVGAPGEARRDMTAARVVAMSRIAVRFVVSGGFEIADALISRVTRDATVVTDREPAARAFALSARVARAMWLGDMEPAAALAQEAIICFDVVGDVRNAAGQRDNAGFAFLQLGAFAAAEGVLLDSIAAAERLGLLTVVNRAKMHLGQFYSRTLRTDESVRALTEAVEGFIAQRDPLGEGLARIYRAGAIHLRREHAAAAEDAKVALPLLEQSPPYLAAALGLHALMCIDSGDVEGAYQAGTKAMKILEAYGGTIEGEAIVYIGYAEGLRAKGDVEGSKKAIAAARDRLLSRAALIKTPELRRGFMERLAEHTRILTRTGEWLA
jgi:tetratricopeptide (TPR) repeat protein